MTCTRPDSPAAGPARRTLPCAAALLALLLVLPGCAWLGLNDNAEPATAHMMIVNPLSGGGLFSLFSTHPPMAKRIARLNAMPIEAR